eukprot:CAMPEP_0194532964 /NCGR_PEP_ID=MMETSP0253-20130528/70704_1 /TAXON_ID=2966 /ORGANISM="Noctiluca scintillans" /LENGTH=70 /DNA_ID=CAMNT_0039378469 /DNA_START=81 /DNA_END=290 /DNA_ORIENTATION=-
MDDTCKGEESLRQLSSATPDLKNRVHGLNVGGFQHLVQNAHIVNQVLALGLGEWQTCHWMQSWRPQRGTT